VEAESIRRGLADESLLHRHRVGGVVRSGASEVSVTVH